MSKTIQGNYSRYEVDSIAAMLLLKAANDDNAFITGYHAKGDGGGGRFYFDSTSVEVSDNGFIFGTGTGRWKRIPDGSRISTRLFGAKVDASTDDTTAIQATIDYVSNNGGRVLYSEGSSLFSAKLTITTGLEQEGVNAVLLKNFDGVGMEFTNGADTTRVFGALSIQGTGSFAGTGLVISTSASAHGIEIINSRMIQVGVLRADNHIGDGVRITATGAGNANKCTWDELRATSNNGKGIRCVGIVDDQSVWRINWYTQSNFNGGVHLDTDYTGRQWQGFIYNEGSAGDGAADGIFLGRLRGGVIWVYSEEQSTTGTELVIDTNCSDLHIWDMRANTTDNNASESCVTFNGGTQWLRSSTPQIGRIVAPSFNTVTDIAEKHFIGGSSNVITKEKIYGNGGIGVQAIVFGGTTSYEQTVFFDQVKRTTYGTEVAAWYVRNNGTEDTPLKVIVGDKVKSESIIVNTTDTDLDTISEMFHEVTSVGGGNKASADYVIKLTVNSGSTREEMFRFSQSGDLILSIVGKGVIVTSPDGLTQKRLGIDNAGALSITAP